MAITTEQIKALRDLTGVSIMQCKNALEEAGGDMDKAKIILQKLSAKSALKKADREFGSGTVATYIHAGGNIGAMVELSCETDFVAKNEEFQTLAREIAMQIAAMSPEYVRRSEVNEEAVSKAKEVFEKDTEGKPEEMKEKILEGKLDSYFKEKVLLEQSYIKDDSKTIQGLIDEGIQKFGERVDVARIARFSVV